ncbi:unnamed protein product [Rangifer tarandus platyrhynchus]|uniref:Uncharacterized protein n=1 Tax=Rangifer tarandus platyrhynchus TaxID=3082113 RepID=A0AC59Y8H9_RANTA
MCPQRDRCSFQDKTRSSEAHRAAPARVERWKPVKAARLHTVVLIPVVSWKQGVWAELRPGQPFSTAELGSLSPLAIPSGALQSARKSADSLPLGLSLTRVESQQKL